MDDKRRASGTRPVANAFGGRVRFERQVKGWSQTELARAAGMTTDDIARIETGETAASTELVACIASALDITPTRLAHAAPDAARVTRRGVG